MEDLFEVLIFVAVMAFWVWRNVISRADGDTATLTLDQDSTPQVVETVDVQMLARRIADTKLRLEDAPRKIYQFNLDGERLIETFEAHVNEPFRQTLAAWRQILAAIDAGHPVALLQQHLLTVVAWLDVIDERLASLLPPVPVPGEQAELDFDAPPPKAPAAASAPAFEWTQPTARDAWAPVAPRARPAARGRGSSRRRISRADMRDAVIWVDVAHRHGFGRHTAPVRHGRVDTAPTPQRQAPQPY